MTCQVVVRRTEFDDMPEPAEESARRMIEWFCDSSFEAPVASPPYSDGSIIRLSRQEFANGIPADTFDKALMKSEPSHQLQSVSRPYENN